MSTSTYEKYSNRFKAKVALKAHDEDTIQALSKKHSIPVSTIKEWVREIEERAELLFIEEKASGQSNVVQNYAALLRSTLEASPNGILVTDLERNVITYNQKCVEMWNLPEHIVARGKMEEAMGHIAQMVTDANEIQKKLQTIYDNPEKQVRDIWELQDGRVFEWYSGPCRVGNATIGRIAHFVDITDFKKTEEKLSRFGNLLQSINANVNEGILRSTPEDGLVYVNDAFVEIFGYDSQDEVLATDPAAFYASEDIRRGLIQELKDEGQFKNEEILFKRKDGSTFWGLENSTLVQTKDKTYIDGVITNIDNWKEAEQALRESEEKYRSILRNIEEGYFETDLKGNFTFFNNALVDIMGYSADEMIGMNHLDYVEKKEAPKVFAIFNRVYKTGNSEQDFDWELIGGDGSRIHVEASVTLRKDSEGNPLGFSGMVRDISERKEKEKQIRDALKEKEVLLEEIHHRVKNNLAVISGLLYLQSERTTDEIAANALMQSQHRINSMALIHELLYDNKTFSSINPDEYIRQLVEHISDNLKTEAASITTKIEAENFDLEMNTAIPCALIINELITNAYKYAFKGRDEGTINIGFHKNADGDYKLTVADDGVGLPEDFALTNTAQHGLGLSLVKTLSRQLKGELDFKSENGARFIITFSGAA
jgi:PAS domain S-box-containing protein